MAEDVPQSWQIVRTTYRRAQEDGSYLLDTRYKCPACEEEARDLATLSAHLLNAHGVHLPVAPAEEGKSIAAATECRAQEVQQDAAAYAVASDYRVFLGNGESRYRCPTCEELFLEGIEFLKHGAAAHGLVYTLDDAPDSLGSDVYDSLHQARCDTWYEHRDQLLCRMHVVSLGSFCGAKFSIQRMGLGNAHLPFDWIRSTSAGVQHFLKNDFRDFFAFTSDTATSEVHLRRSHYHCFFHDDIVQESVRDKLQRRIGRLLALRDQAGNGTMKDLLFVRTCASTEELRGLEDLYTTLLEGFGGLKDGMQSRRVLLLVVIDGQSVFRGPILHDRIPGIMLFMQPFDETAMSPDGQAYCWAITTAANAALLVPEDADPAEGFGLRAGPACPCPSVPSGEALLHEGSAGNVTAWDGVHYVTYGDVRYECFETEASRQECSDS